jgi:hypothetical protein
MDSMVHVTAVEVVGAHRVHVSFDDGADGEVQFTDEDWGGVFDALRDPAFFAQVTVDDELGTIVWPNGADVAPETLHAWATRGRDRQPA